MSHDEFTKLFKYLEKWFGDMDQRFDAVENRVGKLELGMAESGGRLKHYHEEVLVIAHQTNRLEHWVHELTTHTGAKLSLE